MKDVVPQKLGLMDISAAVVCLPCHVCVAIEASAGNQQWEQIG